MSAVHSLQTGPTPNGASENAGLLATVKGRLSFKPLVYGYANARAHGMVSQLLPPDKVKALVDANTVDAIVEMLEHTAYQEDLVALSLRFKREELVELALGRQFARVASTLLKITPPAGADTMRAMLSRWDVHNIKTVILARAQGKKYDEVAPYLVLAGQLNEKQAQALMAAPGGEAFYRALRATAFGAQFARECSSDIKKKIAAAAGDREALEDVTAALDQYVYTLASKAAPTGKDGDVVRHLLSREADAKNLSTLLRLMRSQNEGAKLDAAVLKKYLVPGGTVREKEWVALSNLDSEEAVAGKLEKRLGLTAAIGEYKGRGSLSTFEIAMATANAKDGLRTFARAGMGVGVMVGALLLKENEMGNIRKIVRGKALGLTPDEISNMMIISR